MSDARWEMRKRQWVSSCIAQRRESTSNVVEQRAMSTERHRAESQCELSAVVGGGRCAVGTERQRSTRTFRRRPQRLALTAILLGGAQCSSHVAQRRYRRSPCAAQCMMTLTDASASPIAHRSYTALHTDASRILQAFIESTKCDVILSSSIKQRMLTIKPP